MALAKWAARGLMASGAAVFCLVSLAHGLDEAAAERQVRLPFSLGAFAAASRKPQVADLITARKWPEAVREARLLVAAAPSDPQSTAWLGAALLGAGQPRAAHAAMEVAGRLGWRVDATQRYWAYTALLEGQPQAAAQRLYAILGKNPQAMNDGQLMAPFETDAGARSAFIELMKARPPWLDSYVRRVERLDAQGVVRRATMLYQMGQSGLLVGCSPIGGITHALIEAGDPADAQDLAIRHCPRLGRGLLADGDFAAARLASPQTPFDWQFWADADLGLTFAPAGPGQGRQLVVSADGEVTRLVATHLLVLPAGRYRLSWAAAAPQQTAPYLWPAFGCSSDGRQWVDGTYDAASGRWRADVAVAEACTRNWLTFALRTARNGLQTADTVSLNLSAVRIEAAP